MGSVIEGRWHTTDQSAETTDGSFVRKGSLFRNWVTADGYAGPSGKDGFKASPGRYRLYVSLACPWAHRTLIFRSLKALEGSISVSIVHWFMGDQGWSFHEGSGVVSDTVMGARYLHEIYTASDPTYTGRATVPVLWDKLRGEIVSNESSEIIRMLNSAFDEVGAAAGDFYPFDLREEIDRLNACIYTSINNGVYRAGFAKTQLAYEQAVVPLFETLNQLEHRLRGRRFLCGDRPTEADRRLFTTLVRFDSVYVGHFKCNLRRLVDYENLWAYTRELYQHSGIANTMDFMHIKRHYYEIPPSLNPGEIIPVGPELDFQAGQDRAALAQKGDCRLRSS
jgi:glutathionyl-hydroquinone reductase